MAQPGPLIRYPSPGDREIILRRGSSVVLYDRQDRKLRIEHSDAHDHACPTCHRPFGEEEDDTLPETQWWSPDYFRLLEDADHTARAISPQRLLPGSSPPSAAAHPPSYQASSVADDDDCPDYTASADTPHQRISPDAFSPNYFHRNFIEVKELGRGGSGVVLQVRHILTGHNLGDLACKRIPVGDDLPWLTKVLEEVQLLQRLRHPNLVAYMHVWLEHYKPSNFAPSVPHAFILQQFCNAGDLQSFLFSTQLDSNGKSRSPTLKARGAASKDARARILPFDQIRSFFKDITSGLRFLHNEGYVHRDLKPSNCLLHRTPGRLRVLVSDFGETTEENAIRKSSGATGTVSYCAPEVLRADSRTGRFGNFTQKSDIFSLGLIVHLMAYGKLPFANANPRDEDSEDYDRLREEIASWSGMTSDRGNRSEISEALREDLGRLLSLIPEERPTAIQILQVLKSSPNLYETTARVPGGSRRSSMTVDPDNAAYKVPVVEDEPTSPLLKDADRGNSSAIEFESDSSTSESSAIALVRRRVVASPERVMSIHATQKPILLLPPPPARWWDFATRLPRNSNFVASAKLLVFVVKTWTVLAQCKPLAVDLHSAIPLLGLAALDLTGLLPGTWMSAVLVLLHLLALAVITRMGGLCELDWNMADPGR